MSPIRLVATILTLLFVPYAMAQSVPAAPPVNAPDDAPWSDTFKNIHARLLPQAAPLKAGDLATVSVEIQNASDAAIDYDFYEFFVHLPDFQGDGVALILGQNFPPRDTRRLIKATLRDPPPIPMAGVPANADPQRARFTEHLRQNNLRLEPGGSLIVIETIPYILPKAGTYKVIGHIPKSNPNAGGGFGPNDMLPLPELTLTVGPGDPNAAHAYDTHWGAVKDGLRAGLKVDTGARPRAQFDIAGWYVFIENTTDHPITFTYSEVSPEFDEMPKVVDAAGKSFPVTFDIPGQQSAIERTRTLAAHESQGLASHAFWILPSDSKESARTTPLLHALPGDYSVTANFRYHLPGSTDLSAALTAGPAPLKITPGELKDRPWDAIEPDH